MSKEISKLSLQCNIELPAWIESWLETRELPLQTSIKAMKFVIALATENVKQGTGGPFGAAVIDLADGQLISVGVNLVTDSGLSLAHAEMVAISLAQHRLGHWNLAENRHLSLITSCEPCAMCFGAVPWSGVRSLVCGAQKMDAEAAGFDEGDKPVNWVQSLRDRQIAVELDVLQKEAATVFDVYQAIGGEIYNAGPRE